MTSQGPNSQPGSRPGWLTVLWVSTPPAGGRCLRWGSRAEGTKTNTGWPGLGSPSKEPLVFALKAQPQELSLGVSP